jgi:hypothetical protein
MFDAQTLQRLEEWAEDGCAPDGLSAADAWLLAVDDDLAARVFATKSEALRAGVAFQRARQERLRTAPVTEEDRRRAGRHINAATAEVWFEYGDPSDPDAGLVVWDEGDDDARWVLVTGQMPNFRIHGWTTVGDAKLKGRRVGEG